MARIQASLIFILWATILPAPAIGPMEPEQHNVYIQDWHIEKPRSFLSIDKFGMRKGYYILSFKDKTHKFEIPIFPEELAWWRNDDSLFSGWKSEQQLKNLANKEGCGPIHVFFASSKYSGIKIRKIELVRGLPENIDVPPEQIGWEPLISENTVGVSKNELHFDKDSLVLLAIIFVCLLPTGILLDSARRSVRPYFKN